MWLDGHRGQQPHPLPFVPHPLLLGFNKGGAHRLELIRRQAMILELGVKEGLDGGAGELEDELDEDDEDHQLDPPGCSDKAVTQLVPDVAGHKVKAVDNGQHYAPCRAALDKDGQIGPLKVGKNATDDLSCGME